jgi:hypothetical protein
MTHDSYKGHRLFVCTPYLKGWLLVHVNTLSLSTAVSILHFSHTSTVTLPPQTLLPSPALAIYRYCRGIPGGRAMSLWRANTLCIVSFRLCNLDR